MFVLPDISHLVPLEDAPKVKARLMATLLPAMEAALAGGYTHAQIHAWLVKHGVTISFRYYECVIHRLRKQRAVVRTFPSPDGALPPIPANQPDQVRTTQDATSLPVPVNQPNQVVEIHEASFHPVPHETCGRLAQSADPRGKFDFDVEAPLRF